MDYRRLQCLELISTSCLGRVFEQQSRKSPLCVREVSSRYRLLPSGSRDRLLLYLFCRK